MLVFITVPFKIWVVLMIPMSMIVMNLQWQMDIVFIQLVLDQRYHQQMKLKEVHHGGQRKVVNLNHISKDIVHCGDIKK